MEVAGIVGNYMVTLITIFGCMRSTISGSLFYTGLAL